MIIDLEAKVEIAKKNFTAVSVMIESNGLFFYDMYSVRDKRINVPNGEKVVGVGVRSEMKDNVLLFVSDPDLTDKFKQEGKLNVVVKENSIGVSYNGEKITSKDLDQQMLRRKYKERNLSKNLQEDMFKNFFGSVSEGFINFKDDQNVMYLYFATALAFMCLSLYLVWVKDGKKIKLKSIVIILLLLGIIGVFLAKKYNKI